MPKRPSAIDASTLLATKQRSLTAASGSLQRGQNVTETLVDLNFKVPPEFRDHFRRLAFEARLKNVQLLVRALEAWERGEGREFASRKP
jgi:methylphosphotriester-DNA--protein-cysteine methyltransferase